MKTPKHVRSGQAKAGGFVTASTKGNYVESRSKAVASDDDDDFMPSRVTTKNVPIVNKVPTKKQRRYGKTRAVIELLGQHWGFYFNVSSDDWGSINTLFWVQSSGSDLKDSSITFEVSSSTFLTLAYLSVAFELKD
ncbi:hypothetical protein BGZ82_001659 [Podila clonocystis]|nr:hypothetical protein BGZ82_001659 [Podila clonocystis]